MILELKTKVEIGTSIPVQITSVINRPSDWQVVFYAAKNPFCCIKLTCPRPAVGGGLPPKSAINCKSKFNGYG